MLPIHDNVPHRRPPVVTVALIAANTGVFIFQLMLPEAMHEKLLYLFGVVPARFTHPRWAAWVGFPADNYWPFLTSQFLHGGLFHLIMNMWTLWLFGDNVEDRMGHGRFLIFYLICGALSGVGHTLVNSRSTIPAIGASGAIAGVMGAYFLLYPLARLVVLVPVFFYPLFFEIPAFFYLFFWFVMQLFSGTASILAPGAGGGIAWWAHVGGFAAGAALCGLFVRRRPRRRIATDPW
ncbi:MAG: rhomboid family intramembrane serine protease [Candidatus Sumerlaeia bacterium]